MRAGLFVESKRDMVKVISTKQSLSVLEEA